MFMHYTLLLVNLEYIRQIKNEQNILSLSFLRFSKLPVICYTYSKTRFSKKKNIFPVLKKKKNSKFVLIVVKINVFEQERRGGGDSQNLSSPSVQLTSFKI